MNGGKLFMYIIGIAGIIVIAREFITKGFMGALSMNLIIFLFIVANCFLYKTPRAFIEAYKDNMKLACEIIVQFPFYGGIMGIMQDSGLAQVIVAGIVSIATAATLPVWSFISAAIVNLFIPSQGGQIIVQGPLLLDAANQLGANKIDVINAFVYGDECTNLLQPLYLIPMLAVAIDVTLVASDGENVSYHTDSDEKMAAFSQWAHKQTMRNRSLADGISAETSEKKEFNFAIKAADGSYSAIVVDERGFIHVGAELYKISGDVDSFLEEMVEQFESWQ